MQRRQKHLERRYSFFEKEQFAAILDAADKESLKRKTIHQKNAEQEQNQDLYNKKYAEYEEQMNTVDAELQRMRQKKADQIARKELLEGMIREIVENDLTVTEIVELSRNVQSVKTGIKRGVQRLKRII